MPTLFRRMERRRLARVERCQIVTDAECEALAAIEAGHAASAIGFEDEPAPPPPRPLLRWLAVCLVVAVLATFVALNHP